LDRDRIKQVLVNLIDNAIKYSPAGSPVTLRVRADDGGVEIDVDDHGLGIPAEALPTLFDKFRRVDTRTNRETYGAGLGLYIARAIVEAHGGHISVESRVGEGSRFTVALPLDPGDDQWENGSSS
jgi:signal transduction histidine kinase